ncbi:MAG TPA: hypothetical protein VHE35_13720 [Kofleriaceae bacterium]|nr:hypothetical protein [Kofleriaceae bacterium]
MRLTRLALAAVALAVLLGGVRRAAAYPQFQLSTGNDRCSACHDAPSGGGLLNDFGRSEAGDTISRGGDGAFLHGLWEPPRWLQLGGDLRGATGLSYTEPRRDTFLFPMQVDLYVRAGTDTLSLHVTGGLRGVARDPAPPFTDRLVSREHYVMWRPALGTYVRAGRFFPVFGLRSQDHTAYVRRYLGFDLLEEPYGLAAGRAGAHWEAHASIFVPSPIRSQSAGVRASGGVLYVERRLLDDRVALAGQARLALGPDDSRFLVGGVGKRWFEGAGVMLMGEVDLQRQDFDASRAPTRYQLACYLGATKDVVHGVQAGVALQRWQPDLTLRSSRDAFEVDLQYFPRAHLELHLLARASGAGNDLDDPTLLTLLQLHYYL